MAQAGQLKDQGNALFKAGKHDEAILMYSQAADSEDATNEVKAICYGNISVCYSKLNNNDKCLEYCDWALSLKPDYEKVRDRKIGILLDTKKLAEARLELDKGSASAEIKAKVESAERQAKEESEKFAADEEELEREADREIAEKDQEKADRKRNLAEMTTSMKELANNVLLQFGMSLDGFKVTKSKEGKYCVDFS